MTNYLPIIEVEELPKTGESGILYRCAYDDGGYVDYVWGDERFYALGFDSNSMNLYIETLVEKVADLEARVEELEGKGKVLFDGRNIELTESGATIGKRSAIVTNIEVTAGTVFHCTLENMTIDGQPVPDASGDITAYQVPDWDWQGGELYDVEFGNGAYFAFGTEPKDAVATTATLGFVNENGDFDVRTLVIGHLKVEVD